MTRTPRPVARPTTRQAAEGLGATCVLLAGLIGIPAVLAASVGWPLPQHIPSGAQLSNALHSAIPASFWPRLFATLGWLAWAYFAACVAINVAAQVQGRRGNRSPRFAAQSAVAALVTAALVLGQLRGAPSARNLSPVPVVHLVAVTATDSAAAPAETVHTVVEGDTLWGIATAYYGEGDKWPAIYQANAGVPQPGGGALSDPHWIYPGWNLVIPDVPETAPVAPMPPPGLTPAAPPATAPQVPATPAPANGAGRLTAPSSSTGKTHSVTGRRASKVPSRPAAPVVPVHRVDRSRVAGQPAHASAQKHRRAPERPMATSDIEALAIGGGVFGLGAIGLVGALDRRRRRQSSQRAKGRRIPLPAAWSALADLERQLRQYARTDSVFWLSRLGEFLGQATAGRRSPQVLGVRLGEDALDVLVTADSGDAPPPFESRPGSSGTWRLSYPAAPGTYGGDTWGDAPGAEAVPLTLATLGQDPEGSVLVNLEHYASVQVLVDASRVPGTLAAIGTELAGSRGSRVDKVIAIGVGHGVIDRLPGGLVLDDLDAFFARPGSEAERVVVLADASVATDQLIETVSGSSTCRLVLAGPSGPAGVGLVFDPADPVLAEHELAPLEATHVTDQVLDDVGALLDLAEAPPTAEPYGEPYRRLEVPSVLEDAPPADRIVLGILGDPSIALGDGEPQGLLEAVSPVAGTKARRVVELLVYLAGHNGAASRGEWLTDVSPDKALGDGYVRNLVLLARRSLQAITGDSELLTYDRTSQRLSLDERVRTDWAMFRSLASNREPEELRTALALVRGAPFGSAPEPWTSATGTYYVMVDDVTEAAGVLAEQALRTGGTRLATWAARKGLLANRYDQGLWRVLLRAGGDSGAVQRVWDELHGLLAVDGDSSADLDPDTVDLYNSLMTPRRDTGEVLILQDDDHAVIPTRQAV